MSNSVNDNLHQLFIQTLDPSTQKSATHNLLQIEIQPGFANTLVQLLANDSTDPTLRFTVAVYFKNYIKRNWVPDDENSDRINAQDREMIKNQVVSLMITVPERMQLQISDALSIIASEDFPDRWQTLLPELVSRFSDTDYKTNNGILQTAHSIFKKWRSQFKCDELFSEIKYVLDIFCPKYLELFGVTDNLMDRYATDANALAVLSQSMLLLIKIYYDLNCQDLPEFCEDNLPLFSNLFKKYLVYANPLLASDDEEEPGMLEKMKTSICEIIDLYAQRYYEDFPQLGEFLPIIFNLIAGATPEAKYDMLVCKALGVLNSAAKLDSQRDGFSNDETMRNLCQNIILPNVTLRTSDEELFEDNPIEYIRRDIEGSDLDTRRRAAADFVRGLMERFEGPVTAIFTQYIANYLETYKSNPQGEWKAKDTAIFLLVAISAKRSNSFQGVTQTNALVNIVEFFTNNVLQDLQSDVNQGVPILKVDAIKYLYTFRNQLTKDQLLTVMPLLVSHLQSRDYVVHTYAAIAIDRVLVLRHGNEQVFLPQDIKPYAEAMLTQLFALIEAGQTPEKLSENDYLMKAIFRVIVTSRKDMVPYVNVIMTKLTNVMAIISKNPSNPKFNHFVFESIGGLIKFVCPVSTDATNEFEKLLFGPFQAILSQSVQEFIPYTFQLMAQLLEHHVGSELAPDYVELLNLVMNPSYWEQGNIPALVRLLEAYLNRGINNILATNRLETILGIFQQKLINSRLNDHFGMTLLNSVIKAVPWNVLKNYMPALVSCILRRLQGKRRDGKMTMDRFTRNVTLWFCLFFTLERLGSPDELIQIIDSMQPGLFGQLMESVLLDNLNSMRDPIDYKICSFGMVRMLTASNLMFQPNYVGSLWPRTFNALLSQLELPPNFVAEEEENFDRFEMDEENATYQNTFSRLSTTAPLRDDPTSAFPSCKVFLAQQLVALPPDRRAMAKEALAQVTRAMEFLPKYFAEANISLDRF
ncbi:importin-alpha re-exporter [Hesseltinella vesiculosa]|uniref:Importin-alpha re-exporter n=1 Tax=Hesseltinella vesiculosa TaxID=101127 RepID=A0A1X2GWA5_9FUNG|nr:importin-alpha re-exporter [Hesseltinella vesiculosa]